MISLLWPQSASFFLWCPQIVKVTFIWSTQWEIWALAISCMLHLLLLLSVIRVNGWDFEWILVGIHQFLRVFTFPLLGWSQRLGGSWFALRLVTTGFASTWWLAQVGVTLAGTIVGWCRVFFSSVDEVIKVIWLLRSFIIFTALLKTWVLTGIRDLILLPQLLVVLSFKVSLHFCPFKRFKVLCSKIFFLLAVYSLTIRVNHLDIAQSPFEHIILTFEFLRSLKNL